MSWISVIIYILTNLPSLINVVSQLIELINGLPRTQGKAIKSMMTDAIKHHKETGDDSKIRNVCVGVGCPADLVA